MKGWVWIVGGVLMVGAGFWFYKAAQETYGPYGAVRRMSCKSNLMRMAKAALLYTEDHDDRLMPVANWMDDLLARTDRGLKYDMLEETYRCPCGRTPETGPFGYAYNSDIAGKKKSEFELPEHTALFFESKHYGRNIADPLTSFPGPYDPAKPGSERANIAYLAGFVERSVRAE